MGEDKTAPDAKTTAQERAEYPTRLAVMAARAADAALPLASQTMGLIDLKPVSAAASTTRLPQGHLLTNIREHMSLGLKWADRTTTQLITRNVLNRYTARKLCPENLS